MDIVFVLCVGYILLDELGGLVGVCGVGLGCWLYWKVLVMYGRVVMIDVF